MKIEIEIPDELPVGRLNSYLKGVIDGLMPVATSHSPLEYTPEGHDSYRAIGEGVSRQIIEAAKGIAKR